MAAIPPTYDISAETIEKVRDLVNEKVGRIASIFKTLSNPGRKLILPLLFTLFCSF
jgi:hypothetical protein